MNEQNEVNRKNLDPDMQELIAAAGPADKLLMLYAARNLKIGADIEREKCAG